MHDHTRCFSPNPFIAAKRASRSVDRYPEVVPIDAWPRLFCTTWIGTPLFSRATVERVRAVGVSEPVRAGLPQLLGVINVHRRGAALEDFFDALGQP